MKPEHQTMPFSGESHTNVVAAFELITNCGMPIEALDAILGDFKNTGDLVSAMNHAISEWDL